MTDSPRHPLCLGPQNGLAAAIPTLTVELYVKWYELWLVMPDGRVIPVSFEDLESTAAKMRTSAYRDHVPNPRVVAQFAEDCGYALDELAQELIVGRWHLEAL